MPERKPEREYERAQAPAARDRQLSDRLRAGKQAISEAWESLIAEQLPELLRLDRTSRIDHLPEFLDGLAAWIDGDRDHARNAFEMLVTGHAIQRLGYGIELGTLTREYALLRSVILRELQSVPLSESLRDAWILLSEGMDEAIHEAVRRYTEQRDLARDRFVGILAHDLRNPLSSIVMASTRVMAVAAGRDDKLYAMGALINRSGERMTRMVADVLELARGQMGGGIPIALRGLDLGELTAEVVEEIRAAHPDRDLHLVTSGDLRGAFDRDRVMQALSNLIGNAIQHGEDPIEVAVTEHAERRALITSVTSRGRTIPADELPALFDPLRRRERTRREGLGLGLYIVAQIARAHGARCEVASSPDRGTVFTIHWPRARPEETPDRNYKTGVLEP